MKKIVAYVNTNRVHWLVEELGPMGIPGLVASAVEGIVQSSLGRGISDDSLGPPAQIVGSPLFGVGDLKPESIAERMLQHCFKGIVSIIAAILDSAEVLEGWVRPPTL